MMIALDARTSRQVSILFEAIEQYEHAIEAYSDGKVGPVYLIDKYSTKFEFQFPRPKMVAFLKERVEELEECLKSLGVVRASKTDVTV